MSVKRTKFQRHPKKAKKLYNENYLKDIKYHAVSESSDICYIKANCKPSIKNTVQVGNAGQLSSVYTLNVCLTKLTGHIISAYCNCKAGEAGLSTHVGSLLFSIVRMKNACTSHGCTCTYVIILPVGLEYVILKIEPLCWIVSWKISVYECFPRTF